MKRLRGDRGGVSEIVGALMITLIVVIAASSFAIFISQRQEATQDQQLLEQKRALENVTVLGVRPQLNTTSGNTWKSMNFTISSLHTGITSIESIWINGYPLYNGTMYRIGPSGSLIGETYSFTSGIKMDELEYIYLNVTSENLFHKGVVFLVDRNINIELSTELLNSFHVNFVPPSAIITIDVLPLWNNTLSRYDMSFLLDASLSDQIPPGYVLNYSWIVDHSGSMNYYWGRKVVSDVQLTAGDSVTLMVTNNFGMVGIKTLMY
jgi:hypothetical protein